MNDDSVSTAIATVAPMVMAPTRRSPQQLASRLSQMRQERGLVATFFKDVMVSGEDYGIIPGTEKPTLFKPGAEKLAELYGFHPMVKHRDEITDYDTGFYRCVVTMALINDQGQSVGEGIGECNTREARYFYRWVTANKIPAGIDKASLKSEERTNRQTHEKFKLYRLENDDLFSLWNTVLKMAKKRALVDVVLSVTRSSSVFSKTTKGITDWIDAEYKDISDLEEEDNGTEGINAAPITPEGKKPEAPAKPSTETVEVTAMASTDQRNKILALSKTKWPVGQLLDIVAERLAKFRPEFTLEGLTSKEADGVIEWLEKGGTTE